MLSNKYLITQMLSLSGTGKVRHRHLKRQITNLLVGLLRNIPYLTIFYKHVIGLEVSKFYVQIEVHLIMLFGTINELGIHQIIAGGNVVRLWQIRSR